MKYLSLILLILMLSHCATPEQAEMTNVRVQDDGFDLEVKHMKSEFEKLEKELNMLPRNIQYSRIEMVKNLTCGDNTKSTKINGCCRTNNSIKYARIRIDYHFWNTSDVKTRWGVMYHEMLHCYHGIGHIPNTIMDPKTSKMMIAINKSEGKTFSEKLKNATKQVQHESK